MNDFLRESVTVAIAGVTMLALVVDKGSAGGPQVAFATIAAAAAAIGLLARGRRRARTDRTA